MRTAESQKNGDVPPDVLFDKLAGIVSTACIGSNPKITVEWVLNNLSINKMVMFLGVITSTLEDVEGTKETSETPAKN